MECSNIIEKVISRAKKCIKKIVLPESTDLRILEAASIIASQNISQLVLLGNRDEILKKCSENDINILSENIEIIDPLLYVKKDLYISKLFELRQHKGMTLENAKELLKDNIYFGTMMVKQNDADGLVCGAIHATQDTLRPALQIIKQRQNLNVASSFFLMESRNDLCSSGVYIFADCGLIQFPTEDQLVDITNESVKSFRNLVGDEPRVALLSYSTKGSAKSEAVNKTLNVLNKLKELKCDYIIDGELQLDAAIIPQVARLKAQNSPVEGKANILIFPDIQAGNIGYKLTQRFGNVLALGPITQGLNKPINDLSRGCSINDIVGVIAITCVQANS
ncbi:MAG: phosphate acetyltransferase [Clostridia bacterium]